MARRKSWIRPPRRKKTDPPIFKHTWLKRKVCNFEFLKEEHLSPEKKMEIMKFTYEHLHDVVRYVIIANNTRFKDSTLAERNAWLPWSLVNLGHNPVLTEEQKKAPRDNKRDTRESGRDVPTLMILMDLQKGLTRPRHYYCEWKPRIMKFLTLLKKKFNLNRMPVHYWVYNHYANLYRWVKLHDDLNLEMLFPVVYKCPNENVKVRELFGDISRSISWEGYLEFRLALYFMLNKNYIYHYHNPRDKRHGPFGIYQPIEYPIPELVHIRHVPNSRIDRPNMPLPELLELPANWEEIVIKDFPDCPKIRLCPEKLILSVLVYSRAPQVKAQITIPCEFSRTVDNLISYMRFRNEKLRKVVRTWRKNFDKDLAWKRRYREQWVELNKIYTTSKNKFDKKHLRQYSPEEIDGIKTRFWARAKVKLDKRRKKEEERLAKIERLRIRLEKREAKKLERLAIAERLRIRLEKKAAKELAKTERLRIRLEKKAVKELAKAERLRIHLEKKR